MTTHRIIAGDCIAGLRTLPDASVHCCCTSPPYWNLRDYGHDGQIGLEPTPEAYVARMVEVFREVRRVLREDATCWLNLGDSMLPSKCEAMIPHRVAMALMDDGWICRQTIIWHKPNPMPESVRDRCTKAHEYVFLLTKSERYFYDAEAVSEASETFGRQGRSNALQPKAQAVAATGFRNDPALKDNFDRPTRNRRSVWTITTKPYSGAHFAVMPPDLVEPCIKAGTSEEGCCPACGAPWERVVERGESDYKRLGGHNGDDFSRADSQPGNKGHTRNANGVVPSLRAAETHTTGWRPACTCGGSPVPCTVLDPFAGSGTTLAVAAELGRSGIGCELNPEYIRLAEQRIREARAAAPLFT